MVAFVKAESEGLIFLIEAILVVLEALLESGARIPFYQFPVLVLVVLQLVIGVPLEQGEDIVPVFDLVVVLDAVLVGYAVEELGEK